MTDHLKTYAFPAMPEIVGKTEEFDAFSRECAAVLKQRAHAVEFTSPDYTEHNNAFARFNIARLEEDHDLIAAYSRFLLHGYPANDIQTSMAAFKLIRPSAHPWRILTAEHLDAYHLLYEAFGEIKTSTAASETTYRMVGKLPVVILCFTDFSMQRAETIAMIIRRGITRVDGIGAALSDFKMLTPSLMEGAL